MTTDTARPEHDYYRTPEWVVTRFLDAWAPTIDEPRMILEPAAGDGALLKPLRTCWPNATIDAYDIEPRHTAVIARSFYFDDTPQRYDLVITNPPFKHAEDFVRYGLSRLASGGHLALFLRLGFLGGQARRALWMQHPLSELHAMSQRASFRPDSTSTDWYEYAWFVWRQGNRRRWWKGYVL